MKKKVPLLEELLEYHKENNLILSMPGNKSGIGFLRDEIGREFTEKLGFLDITEVDPLDNLHCPEGIIKEAQELLAKTYGARKAYFMVNGSSGGNLAAIFTCFKDGDEVLVERNCHKSIYNGLILRKLKVTYIEPIVDIEKGIFIPPNEENIYKAFEKCSNPKGIILTHPNYFGICYDIEKVILNLKEKGLKIIIDGAHGAHFGVNNKLPKSIAKLGDYVVLSAHKTLPALTQGGYLLVNEESNVEFYIQAFMTTSPSYLIMASLDYSRYYIDNYGENDYEKLINLLNKWKIKINNIGKVKILDKDDLIEGYDIDLTRYLMLLPNGYSGHKLLDYLRVKKIQAEMSFSSGIVLIFSPCNTNNDLEKIYNAIIELDLNSLREEIQSGYYNLIPEKVMEPYEVFQLESELENIKNSKGKIAKEAIIPYPPGIPLVCAGEIITQDVINIVSEYLKNGRSVIGVDNLKVKVIK